MLTLTLPTIHPDACERTLRNIADTALSVVQVVVVSSFDPFPLAPSGLYVTWVREEEPKGCNAGHAAALARVGGDFIMPWVDDHLMIERGWDLAITDDFVSREENRHFPRYCLGVRQEAGWVGTVFGIYYPYFPMLRTPVAREGFWFDPAYRVGFGDVDLAMRIWHAGGRCEWSASRPIRVHADDGRKGEQLTIADDTERFLKCWAPVYGIGWPTDDLRDFNVDVPPDPGGRSFAPESPRSASCG